MHPEVSLDVSTIDHSISNTVTQTSLTPHFQAQTPDYQLKGVDEQVVKHLMDFDGARSFTRDGKRCLVDSHS
jgi:hypothetical protein